MLPDPAFEQIELRIIEAHLNELERSGIVVRSRYEPRPRKNIVQRYTRVCLVCVLRALRFLGRHPKWVFNSLKIAITIYIGSYIAKGVLFVAEQVYDMFTTIRDAISGVDSLLAKLSQPKTITVRFSSNCPTSLLQE